MEKSELKNKNILLVVPPVICVDKVQMTNYPDMQPTGLLQIGSLLKNRGCKLKLIDMSPENPKDLTFWKYEYAGSDRKIKLPTYILGKSFSFLRSELKESFVPDVILVSCSITFNYQLAFEVIKICKETFPKAYIIFGGAYPTLNPEHAGKSQADEIYVGHFEGADDFEPDLTLLPKVDYIIFRLARGCGNKCSFCINSLEKRKEYCVDKVINYIVKSKRKYKLKAMNNWDPNILLFKSAFLEFLEKMRKFPGIGFSFHMGLQPNLLDEGTIKLMKVAGVKNFSIPFEASSAWAFKRLNKPFTIISSLKALYLARKYKFNTRSCHCCFIFGYPWDDARSIMRTFCSIISLGGMPNPFPVTIIPKTGDFKTYFKIVKDKDFSEYNGHLWPLIKSKYVPHYRNLLYFLNSENLSQAKRRMKLLSKGDRRLFSEEMRHIRYFIRLCLKMGDTHKNLDIINEKLNILQNNAKNNTHQPCLQ